MPSMLEAGALPVEHLAALCRRESRGAHHLEEYPERDDAHWLKNSVVRLDGQVLRVETRDAVLAELRPEALAGPASR